MREYIVYYKEPGEKKEQGHNFISLFAVHEFIQEIKARGCHSIRYVTI